jgi:two-component system, response regulator PdtaR
VNATTASSASTRDVSGAPSCAEVVWAGRCGVPAVRASRLNAGKWQIEPSTLAHVLQGHDAALTPMAISPSQEFSDSAGELEGMPVVLVVEDEVLVRIVQVDILREAGFRVSEAQDADEAFEMLRSRPEISAVLTDVDMPGSLNGFEFARLVKQGWPEVGVLAISGKTQPAPGDLPQGVEFVQKPVRPAALVDRIRGVMPFSN